MPYPTNFPRRRTRMMLPICCRNFSIGSVAGGILHFANAGKCTWQEYAQWALDCCRDAGVSLKGKTVGALKLSEMTRLRQGSGRQAPWVARRPIYSVLSTAKYTESDGHVISRLARGSC